MIKSLATRHTFARLELDALREIGNTEPSAIAPQPSQWATRDDVIRIVARIRAQLSPTDRVLMFTGVTAGSGGFNLAWETALALSKLETGRILLMDCDTDAPKLDSKLGIGVSPGLAEAITEDRFKDAVRTVAEGRLYALPSGKCSRGPAALFSSPEFGPLMELLRTDYTYVIVSAPAVLANVTATLLSPVVDGVVLTVASGAQRRSEVHAACTELRGLKAKMLGVVLYEAAAPSQPIEG